MLTVYNCITVDHDLRLVILAGFICVFATFSFWVNPSRKGVDAMHFFRSNFG